MPPAVPETGTATAGRGSASRKGVSTTGQSFGVQAVASPWYVPDWTEHCSTVRNTHSASFMQQAPMPGQSAVVQSTPTPWNVPPTELQSLSTPTVQAVPSS